VHFTILPPISRISILTLFTVFQVTFFQGVYPPPQIKCAYPSPRASNSHYAPCFDTQTTRSKIIWRFPSEWLQRRSFGLSTGSIGWTLNKPTFRGPSLSSSSGLWRDWRSSSDTYRRVCPKVDGLAAWSENCKWYSSLPLGAVLSLFLSQSSEFCRHNSSCCFSTGNTSPESVRKLLDTP
jgi:hypothetical protein